MQLNEKLATRDQLPSSSSGCTMAKCVSHQLAGTTKGVFGPDQVLEVRNVGGSHCMLQGSGAGRTNGALRSSLTDPYGPDASGTSYEPATRGAEPNHA